jgi:hypothetical protein
MSDDAAELVAWLERAEEDAYRRVKEIEAACPDHAVDVVGHVHHQLVVWQAHQLSLLRELTRRLLSVALSQDATKERGGDPPAPTPLN